MAPTSNGQETVFLIKETPTVRMMFALATFSNATNDLAMAHRVYMEIRKKVHELVEDDPALRLAFDRAHAAYKSARYALDKAESAYKTACAVRAAEGDEP